MNDYIKYYKENSISPVNQDISDLEVHYRRRQKLYRQLGLPTIAFCDADMIEVGPGGGHNALAPLHWGVRHIELVEPNPTGRENIKKLFESMNVSTDRFTLNAQTIEEYPCEKQFDIVVAEGFLGYVPNAKEVCVKLGNLCRKGGVVVITCSDDVCIFPELMKRLIGWIITADTEGLSAKVEMLIPIFEPQLKSLRGVSRPAKDWIEDNIFNPAFSNGYSYSMGDAITIFRDFDLLGASPSMFTDYSWYKDIWFDEKDSYLSQFDRKRIALAMAGSDEILLSYEDSQRLTGILSEIKKIENDYEKSLDRSLINKLSDYMAENREYVQAADENLGEVYDESIDILNEVLSYRVPNMAEYPVLFRSFGRGLQYMSFMKL